MANADEIVDLHITTVSNGADTNFIGAFDLLRPQQPERFKNLRLTFTGRN